MVLNNYVFEGILKVLKSIFDAPEEQLSIWIHMNEKHFLHFCNHYNNVTREFSESILETEDSQIVYDTIAMFFLQRNWPKYYDGEQEYSSFVEDLKGAAKIMYNWETNL